MLSCTSVRIVIPPLHQDPVDDSVESNEDKCDAYLCEDSHTPSPPGSSR